MTHYLNSLMMNRTKWTSAMKFTKKILFYVLIISGINHVISVNNAKEITTSDVLARANNSTLCKSAKCIMKCCPFGKYFEMKLVYVYKRGKMRPSKRRTCGYLNITRDITSYENDNKIFSNRPNLSIYNVKSGIFEANGTFMNQSVDFSSVSSFNVYLTEHPEIYLEMPNAYDRWIPVPNDMFCWDFKIENSTDGKHKVLNPGIWVFFQNNKSELSRTSDTLLTTAMLVSCFFLLVVLVVYGLLQELRNLCGLILMAYVASLFGAFLLLAVMRIQQQNSEICLGLTCSIYYMFLASFCWMHVMSYDIWWTFRGYAKARPIHRRGEKFKFLMYCLYAWGLPLAMAIGLAVLNETDMSHVPWFVTPKIPTNGCFIEGGEKLLYLYMPMLILILCNWLFYMMTAYNIWRLSRGTAVLDSAAAGTPQSHRTHRQRFLVYLKLSIVMGLNWVLEVVSYKYPGHNIWFLSDFYNILIGVSIFLIFVCKRKILRKLVKLYKKEHWRPGQVDSVKSTTSTSDSSSTSQEIQTLQVCSNPKGPAYTMKSF